MFGQMYPQFLNVWSNISIILCSLFLVEEWKWYDKCFFYPVNSLIGFLLVLPQVVKDFLRFYMHSSRSEKLINLVHIIL